MKKGTKILMVVGALAVAGTVLYFVNKKYGWVNLGGSVEVEATAPASGCGCGK
jgi:hypothetical protein